LTIMTTIVSSHNNKGNNTLAFIVSKLWQVA